MVTRTGSFACLPLANIIVRLGPALAGNTPSACCFLTVRFPYGMKKSLLQEQEAFFMVTRTGIEPMLPP